jgi:hypothetical protein
MAGNETSRLDVLKEALPMPLRILLFLFATVLAVSQTKMTLDQLKGFIKSSVSNHLPDKQVAEYVHKIQLSNKLDDRTVEELQGLGAGPKTVAALHDLRDSSASLPAAAPPPPKPVYVPPPPPNSIEQKQVLADATEYAHNYSARMPDFICTQVTRRFYDPMGGEEWRGRDTITERLSYFEHKENYTVVFINGSAVTNVKHEQLGGTTASGEFASMMEEIFDPKTQTDFEWERWATLRGKRMHVFSYKVLQSRSNYRILAQGAEPIVVGYHGLIYVDRETSRIYKITLTADDIPSTYPVRAASLTLDYDMQRIAESEFLLPLKSVVTLKAEKSLNTKNEAEFHAYRKFSAEATIKDIEPEPIPDSAIKDQPPAPQKKN